MNKNNKYYCPYCIKEFDNYEDEEKHKEKCFEIWRYKKREFENRILKQKE